MDLTQIANVKWPHPWRPIEDEFVALALGRRWEKEDIAPTIVGELRREICDRHPLFGVECIPVAFDAQTPKEFLLLTSKPNTPVVLVHFTWHREPDPRFPFIVPFESIEDFVAKERKRLKKWWQFWI